MSELLLGDPSYRARVARPADRDLSRHVGSDPDTALGCAEHCVSRKRRARKPGQTGKGRCTPPEIAPGWTQWEGPAGPIAVHEPTVTGPPRSSAGVVVLSHGFPVDKGSPELIPAGLVSLSDRLSSDSGWRVIACCPGSRWVGRELLARGVAGRVGSSS